VTKIYYFSGTGNSLWSARAIAGAIGGEHALINIGAEAGGVVEADAVVLVFPSYAFGLPLAVRRFATNTEFRTPYLAAFTTYGSTPGGTLAALWRILKRKNIGSVFLGRIPAVENYIAIFGPPKEKTERRRLEMQSRATMEAARQVTERRVPPGYGAARKPRERLPTRFGLYLVAVLAGSGDFLQTVQGKRRLQRLRYLRETVPCFEHFHAGRATGVFRGLRALPGMP